MKWSQRDIIIFAAVFAAFFTLIYGGMYLYQAKTTKQTTTYYDSSSIKNQEELPDDFMSLEPTAVTSSASGSKKTEVIPSILSSATPEGSGSIQSEVQTSSTTTNKAKTAGKFSFSFQPDAASVDTKLLSYIQENLGSSKLKDILPTLSIIINTEWNDPRGKTAGSELTISSLIDSDSEFIKVFVHELGHVVDIRSLVASDGKEDPSNDFYKISWLDYEHKVSGATLSDFVSGYALSNKYEDFAESFAFYIFHNEEFRTRADKNSALAKKYVFFRDVVFNNGDFSGVSFEKKAISQYNWDTTKISIDTKKYLFYLK